MRNINRLGTGVVLLVALPWLGAAAAKTTTQVIIECRQDSFDTQGLSECIDLRWQESEGSLIAIEELWRDHLNATDGVSATDGSTQSLLVSNSPTQEAPGVNDKIATEVKVLAAKDGVVAIVGAPNVSEATDAETTRAEARPATADSPPEIGPQDLAGDFEQLGFSYRQYRDQSCRWQSAVLSTGKPAGYEQACKTALNLQRLRALRTQLSEKRVSDRSGQRYRGYYLRTDAGGSFQACEQREDWLVVGSASTLQTIARRYDALALDNLEMVYAELRGRALAAGDSLAESDFAGRLQVRNISLMRPILEQDCQLSLASVLPAPADQSIAELRAGGSEIIEDDTVVAADDVTIDELGESGYLYGYFSNWMSVCAVEENQVCRTQTDAEISSFGEWQLMADRSYDRIWRVRLIPTTGQAPSAGTVTLYIDEEQQMSQRISEAGGLLTDGLTLARGGKALQLINRMRAGQRASFRWSSVPTATTQFSLSGITRALRYFDDTDK